MNKTIEVGTRLWQHHLCGSCSEPDTMLKGVVTSIELKAFKANVLVHWDALGDKTNVLKWYTFCGCDWHAQNTFIHRIAV